MDDEKVKPWRWPGMWFQQETFWRDVGSRALAGLIVVLIGYLFALAGGYVSRPNVLRTFLLLVAVAVGGALHFYVIRWIRRLQKVARRKVADRTIANQFSDKKSPSLVRAQRATRQADWAFLGMITITPIGYIVLVIQVLQSA